MRLYLPIIFSVVITSLLTLSVSRMMRVSARRLWGKYLPKISMKYIILVYGVLSVLWLLGRMYDNTTLLITGASLMSLALLTGLVLNIVLPWPLLYDIVSQKIRQGRKKTSDFDPGRRRFVKVAATSFPLFAMGTVGTGMAGSFGEVRIKATPIRFPALPENLAGLRILHLTDLHLGYYFHLSHLEETLVEAAAHKPDLVLVTGDIADDLDLLPGALDMLGNFKSTHGTYLSLGNHEYIRSIEKVESIIQDSNVPLLKSSNITFEHKGKQVFLAGADDPKTLRGDIRPFLNETISQALNESQSADFRILMSHRPRALDLAPDFNIDLVLSGHTHGGQVGFAGRSVFEGVIEKEPYMWGEYHNQNSRLYTSAGLGHWLPFRLNCPPEAPLIILEREFVA